MNADSYSRLNQACGSTASTAAAHDPPTLPPCHIATAAEGPTSVNCALTSALRRASAAAERRIRRTPMAAPAMHSVTPTPLSAAMMATCHG